VGSLERLLAAAAAAEFNAMEHKVVGEGEVCLDSIKLWGIDMNIQLQAFQSC
jgi:hypothetical protein